MVVVVSVFYTPRHEWLIKSIIELWGDIKLNHDGTPQKLPKMLQENEITFMPCKVGRYNVYSLALKQVVVFGLHPI